MMSAAQTKLYDLKISGSGTSGGGTFKDVKISGSGKIHGDLSCKEFHMSGSGKVDGKVDAEHMKTSGSSVFSGDIQTGTFTVSGSSKCNGNLTAQEVDISGSVKIAGDLIAQTLESSGACKVDGKLQGQSLETSGSLKVGKDCEVESFTSSGSVHIDGLLNADKIDIKLHHHSTIKEIGGETVVVKQSRTGKFFKQVVNFFTQKDEFLHCDLIEGDLITLENTKAKLVRGKHIIIGENCKIDHVEYSHELDTKENAKVERSTKI
ncbi:polymer-forming cytoskeletal protein [Rossellomorea marisflavi]|uniref:polymer-forming cytoskeletal protein n=1 Tax=Rossellomorea marisflavi TaxID=189381 RepID=UPI00296EF101|nr:polymer-forming cytoskeletal protein [Rossellomorea marisflavi]MDW4525932.1 polymer-forming cytoskeletal protein [Rossellomorea marisflavi]